MREPGASQELRNRHGDHLPAGYFDSNNWRRWKKSRINSLDEEDEKIGWDFISSRPYNGDYYHEYSDPTNFPLICRVFICNAGGADSDNLPEEDWPDDTSLCILTDAKDEMIVAFGFTCD